MCCVSCTFFSPSFQCLDLEEQEKGYFVHLSDEIELAQRIRLWVGEGPGEIVL